MERNDRRQERGAATRNQIVEAAIALIAEGGLAAVTAGALATRTGVSKATIFHHYAPLSAVHHAVLDRLVSEMMAAAGSEGPTATSYLLGLGLRSFSLMVEDPRWVAVSQALMMSGVHDASLRPRLVELSRAARVEVAEELLRRAPETPAEVASEIADAAIGALDGLGLHLLLTGDRDAFLEAWKHLAWRLAEGLVEPRRYPVPA